MKPVSKLNELTSKATYDIGDIFYEPVAEIVDSGFDSYGIEVWARKHEVTSVLIDARSWIKTAHYKSELGEIDTEKWFITKENALKEAKKMGEALISSEIATQQYKIDQAQKEKNKLENIRHSETAPN